MLETLAWISLALVFVCALAIAGDLVRHRQPMGIMNIVWPVTALYWSLAALVFYFRAGRSSRHSGMEQHGGEHAHERDPAKKQLNWKQVAIATSHCGAGCALADIVVEFTLFALGVKLLGSELWASYLWDFIAAWALGIVFQYFSIQPMRHLAPLDGLKAAVKADTLSIIAFQAGMYLWMAITRFWLFPNPHLHPNSAAYWLMMQIGMVLGFLTSYPMNRLLIRMGWKEAM
jgi:hypothetical protein